MSANVERALEVLRQRGIAAVVVGGSAGALDALSALLPRLEPSSPFAIVCVLHLPREGSHLVAALLAGRCRLPVKEAESTERVRPGMVYLAPADYHLSIEPDRSFALSVDDPVLFSRPSIDVLFESAAGAYGPNLLGLLLTGANPDGAAGLVHISERGGYTAIEDPATAEFPEMPRAALSRRQPDFVMPLPRLAAMLGALSDVPAGGDSADSPDVMSPMH